MRTRRDRVLAWGLSTGLALAAGHGLAAPFAADPSLAGREPRPPPERRPGPETEPIDTLARVSPALLACWRPPAGLLGFERLEVTARLSVRSDGSLIAEPAVTFATGNISLRSRELLTRSVLEAIRTCTPLRMTPGLGRSIAGRPMSIRFIHVGRRGQGA